MGKVTVYCPLSGCTPEIPAAFLEIFEYSDTDEIPGDIVLEAIRSLVDTDEKSGQEDIMVIGLIQDSGEPLEAMSKEDVLHMPDSSLRIVPHCTMGEYWDFGSVSAPTPNLNDTTYLVSFGSIIMVQTASLPILGLASDKRMTPQRLWKVAILLGHYDGTATYGLSKVDYGEIAEARNQFPSPVPGFSVEKLISLEKLGDVALVKKTIIEEGMFWVWMRPDRFPLNPTTSCSSTPIALRAPSSLAKSQIETLPIEIATHITSSLPLQDILSLLSTSCSLRYKLIGFSSDRDGLARAWIRETGIYYNPQPDSQSPKNDMEEVSIGWDYLQQCCRSGSMRNRKRIWGVVQQLERLADEQGV